MLSFGHRSHQTTKDGHPSERQIGATIIHTELGVHFENRIGLIIIARLNFTIRPAGDDAIDTFGHREAPSGCSLLRSIRGPCLLEHPFAGAVVRHSGRNHSIDLFDD